MNAYLIAVKIQTGAYEKHVNKLVFSISQEDAEKQALLNECHGEIGENSEWTDFGIEDLFGEFNYSISDSSLVPTEHAEILKLYLN